MKEFSEGLPNPELLAAYCHEMNKRWCELMGDFSQLDWEEVPEWQKASGISGVKYLLANPEATPRDSHANWLKDKEADGWTYGEVKDPEKKMHPCFVPYDELPAAQRVKDVLFHGIVRALTK